VDTSAVRLPVGAPWRLRPWSGDPTVGHLVFLDHARLPTEIEVAAALERADQRGYRAVRTSALFPPAADVLARIGFAPLDRLALLRLDQLAGRRLLRPDHATHALRTWQRNAAAAVDRAAFGPEWGNDTSGLGEIERATPRHRSRWAAPAGSGRRGALVALAISGAAGRTGYLQRLAVHPDMQRQGLGAALVADALAWMQSLGLAEVLVNTGVTNRPALELYSRLGFVRLADVLTIGEYQFERSVP
jgi:ribosomal protein S18 acetylase RimI-like enzyme